MKARIAELTREIRDHEMNLQWCDRQEGNRDPEQLQAIREQTEADLENAIAELKTLTDAEPHL